VALSLAPVAQRPVALPPERAPWGAPHVATRAFAHQRNAVVPLALLEMRHGHTLARIEPADEPDHDLRTFECTACGQVDVAKIKFR
jgi:hypothetical protein